MRQKYTYQDLLTELVANRFWFCDRLPDKSLGSCMNELKNSLQEKKIYSGRQLPLNQYNLPTDPISRAYANVLFDASCFVPFDRNNDYKKIYNDLVIMLMFPKFRFLDKLPPEILNLIVSGLTFGELLDLVRSVPGIRAKIDYRQVVPTLVGDEFYERMDQLTPKLFEGFEIREGMHKSVKYQGYQINYREFIGIASFHSFWKPMTPFERNCLALTCGNRFEFDPSYNSEDYRRHLLLEDLGLYQPYGQSFCTAPMTLPQWAQGNKETFCWLYQGLNEGRDKLLLAQKEAGNWKVNPVLEDLWFE